MGWTESGGWSHQDDGGIIIDDPTLTFNEYFEFGTRTYLAISAGTYTDCVFEVGFTTGGATITGGTWTGTLSLKLGGGRWNFVGAIAAAPTGDGRYNVTGTLSGGGSVNVVLDGATSLGGGTFA